MQIARFLEVITSDRIAHGCDARRREISNRVHQTRRSDRKHWQAQRLETTENAKLGSHQRQALSQKFKIVGRVLQSDEIRKTYGEFVEIDFAVAKRRHHGSV